jgi:serine/threonine-protein kinase RsbW
VQIMLSLSLPRDEQTIPVARHIASNALDEIGVDEEAVQDIAIALTEACTNVLKHSGPGEEYVVSVEVDEADCTIRVKDTGRGFDSSPHGFEHADISAEEGRGIELMRALVDQVRFISKPEDGTVVHLEKSVDYGDGTIGRRAMTRP